MTEEAKATEAEPSEKEFDLSGGRLCLDFANTLGGPVEARREDLRTYDDLIAWSRQSEGADSQEAATLSQVAQARPGEAEQVLTIGLALREAIYQVFSAAAGGRNPEPSTLAALNAALVPLLARSSLAASNGSFAWIWAGPPDSLERPLWAVARATVDLLTSPDLAGVRECASPTCSWLFVDTSRNHSRRWCDMKSCGNRAKARRHYERHKDG